MNTTPTERKISSKIYHIMRVYVHLQPHTSVQRAARGENVTESERKTCIFVQWMSSVWVFFLLVFGITITMTIYAQHAFRTWNNPLSLTWWHLISRMQCISSSSSNHKQKFGPSTAQLKLNSDGQSVDKRAAAAAKTMEIWKWGTLSRAAEMD